MTRTLLMECLLFLFCPSYGIPAVPCEGDASFHSLTDSLTVMFWNLENFFDARDSGGGGADHEFSYSGLRRWTGKRFNAKRNRIAKTILLLGERYGGLPDVIGFAEVENSYVLRSICNSVPLKKLDYGYVHYDSPDHRGIDVGLVYRKSTVMPVSSSQVPLVRDGDTLQTRAILQVRARCKGSGDLLFLVNHHPSKFSGTRKSRDARILAMKTMLGLCTCPKESGGPDGIIAMGDFNDVPEASQMDAAEGILVNLGRLYHGKEKVRKEAGTIRFEGKWQLIDFFMVSPGMENRCSMSVGWLEHLLEWDGRHTGYKPFRTFYGPFYHGGTSDHLPVLLRVGKH